MFILVNSYPETRGGGKDTRLEAKAKYTKKNPKQRPRTAFPRTDPLEAKDRNARGQGQGPRTQAQVFSEKKVFKKVFQAISKKKVLQNNFSDEKGRKKFVFRQSPIDKNKKRSPQIFREVSGVYQQNFISLKNIAVLEPRTGQFSKTLGFEGQDQGQGLQNVSSRTSSRPRRSLRTPPLPKTVKDLFR